MCTPPRCAPSTTPTRSYVGDTRAINFAFNAEEGDAIRRDWLEHGPGFPLDVDEAPYRDIGGPLVSYLRELTGDGTTQVIVVMPELVVRGWRRALHNQRALYVKRLLLFEPRVILASVPYQVVISPHWSIRRLVRAAS